MSYMAVLPVFYLFLSHIEGIAQLFVSKYIKALTHPKLLTSAYVLLYHYDWLLQKLFQNPAVPKMLAIGLT